MIRVPERWRGHLPEAFDVASTASNLIPSLALGVAAMEASRRLPSRERLAVATAAIGVSAVMNFAIEDKTVNELLIVDEMHDIAGYGINGEVRDIAHGISGTALGIAFSTLPGTVRRRSKTSAA
jgi:hypothetical protein